MKDKFFKQRKFNDCMNKGVFVSVIFISLFLIGFVCAKPTIDSNVEIALQSQNQVRVIIEFNQTLSEDILNNLKSNLLLSLSESEFKLGQNLDGSYWLSGELTNEGLEKLKSNEDIIKISMEGGGDVAEDLLEKSEKSNHLLYWIIGLVVVVLLILIINKIE